MYQGRLPESQLRGKLFQGALLGFVDVAVLEEEVLAGNMALRFPSLGKNAAVGLDDGIECPDL